MPEGCGWRASGRPREGASNGTSWVLCEVRLGVRHASRTHVLLDKVSGEAGVTSVPPAPPLI